MAGDRASVASLFLTKDALSTGSQRRRYQNPSGEQMECLGIDRWKSQGWRKMISSYSPQKSVSSRILSHFLTTSFSSKGNERAQCCSPMRLSIVVFVQVPPSENQSDSISEQVWLLWLLWTQNEKLNSVLVAASQQMAKSSLLSFTFAPIRKELWKLSLSSCDLQNHDWETK